MRMRGSICVRADDCELLSRESVGTVFMGNRVERDLRIVGTRLSCGQSCGTVGKTFFGCSTTLWMTFCIFALQFFYYSGPSASSSFKVRSLPSGRSAPQAWYDKSDQSIAELTAARSPDIGDIGLPFHHFLN